MGSESTRGHSMTAIESRSDIKHYKSLFGDLWESAVIRLSLIEMDERLHIPNGEIVFAKDSVKEQETLLYEEGNFKIIQRAVDDPFALLEDLADGQLDGARGVDVKLFEHRPEDRFVGDHESRVFEPRPRSEIHAVYSVELPEDRSSDYTEEVERLQDELQRASEPFYDIGKAEYYYFDHHFRRSTRNDPEILVFAETGIEFELDDEGGLSVTVPQVIADQTAVSVLPQRPYGAKKGWRTEFAEAELEELDGGLVEYQEKLDLPGVEEAYVILFVGDEILEFEEFYNPAAVGDGPGHINSRYAVLDEYDQRNLLEEQLQGNDSDVFEIAVLNLFSIAGYQVQWFGESDLNIPNWDRRSEDLPYDEIDVIAHRPDGSQILFIECTVKRISDKDDLLDRVGKLSAGIGPMDTQTGSIDLFESSHRKVVPVIATSMESEELSHQVVDEYNEKGIVVLDSEKLVDILELSSEQNEPVEIDVEPENWDLDVF